MVPVCSSVMLELVLAVHSYHVIAYPEVDIGKTVRGIIISKPNKLNMHTNKKLFVRLVVSINHWPPFIDPNTFMCYNVILLLFLTFKGFREACSSYSEIKTIILYSITPKAKGKRYSVLSFDIAYKKPASWAWRMSKATVKDYTSLP